MNTAQWILMAYAFFLVLDFVVIFLLILAIRLGSPVLGPVHSHTRGWPGGADGAAELRLRMADLQESAGSFLPKKCLADGRTLIIDKDRMAGARVEAVFAEERKGTIKDIRSFRIIDS